MKKLGSLDSTKAIISFRDNIMASLKSMYLSPWLTGSLNWRAQVEAVANIPSRSKVMEG